MIQYERPRMIGQPISRRRSIREKSTDSCADRDTIWPVEPRLNSELRSAGRTLSDQLKSSLEIAQRNKFSHREQAHAHPVFVKLAIFYLNLAIVFKDRKMLIQNFNLKVIKQVFKKYSNYFLL